MNNLKGNLIAALLLPIAGLIGSMAADYAGVENGWGPWWPLLLALALQWLVLAGELMRWDRTVREHDAVVRRDHEIEIEIKRADRNVSGS